MDLKDKTSILTGTSIGVGAMASMLFTEEGVHAVLGTHHKG